jgi:hypothetical protein
MSVKILDGESRTLWREKPDRQIPRRRIFRRHAPPAGQ